MAGIDERVTRLEARLDGQAAQLSDVAQKVAWIKGYLETRKDPAVPVFKRDAAMVGGGGGVVGGLILLIEKLFGG